MIATAQAFEIVENVHGLSKQQNFRVLGFNNVPNYVQFEFNEPINGGQGGVLYLAKGSIPERSVKALEVKYLGLKVKKPSLPEYSGTYQLTFRMPEDALWRNALEQWNYDLYDEVTGSGLLCNKGTLDVGLLNQAGSITRVYRFFNVWPEKVNAMEYEMTGENNIVEFSVDFAYTRFRPIAVTEGGNEVIHDPELKEIFDQYRSVISSGKGEC